MKISNMKTKTIKQTIRFNASAHSVYEVLMDSKSHGKFTGGNAKISRKIGGKFSVYDGYATGKNLELIPDMRIVQTWRASDWNVDQESQVTFDIEPTKDGCLLRFNHSNVPEEQVSAIKQGWIDFYWQPMKELFETMKK
jgi:activator of HSP90 ATPase